MHLTLYPCFIWGKNELKVGQWISEAYGINVVGASMCWQWGAKFYKEDFFYMKDKECSGISQNLKTDKLELLKQDSIQTTCRKIRGKLTVIHNLQELGKIQKLGKWISHRFIKKEQWSRFKH